MQQTSHPEISFFPKFRTRHVGLLLVCDSAAILGSFWLLVLLRDMIDPLPLELYLSITPLLLSAPLLGLALDTCRRITLPPQRELKALSLSITLSYATLMLLLFAGQRGTDFSRPVVLGAWLLSMCAAPLLRSLVRAWFCRKPWWGVPLILIGRENADTVRASIAAHPERGLFPAAHIAAPCTPDGELAPELTAAARRLPGAFALLLPDICRSQNAGPGELSSLPAQFCRLFSGVLLLPPMLAGNSFIWLTPRDVGYGTALLVRQNLHDGRRLLLKRALDLVCIAFSACIVLPLWAVIALCVRLGSPGPVLYRQRRVGRHGRQIHVCKFRTMVHNADALLAERLPGDAALREEWEQNHKLKYDPRITRVGAFLRKTSLDELPQIWNVLKGEMSLVGPRPIVEEEIEKYGAVFDEYVRVRPGLTGLWQISGRNDTSYDERVRLDQYYVSNWSVWFDIWILARTVPVVLFGRGAY